MFNFVSVTKCIFILISFCFLNTQGFARQYVPNFVAIDNNGIAQELYRFVHFDKVKIIALNKVDRNLILNEDRKAKKNKHPLIYISPKRLNTNSRSIFIRDERGAIIKTLGLKHHGDFLLVKSKKWHVIDKGSLYQTKNGNSALFNQNSKLPNYEKDIAPILINKCISCHSKGMYSFNMANHATIKSWRKMIVETLLTRRMPPGQIDDQYGNFRNKSFLSENDKEQLVSWLNAGAPYTGEDDPLKKAQKIISMNRKGEKWKKGKPDLIFDFPERSVPPLDDKPFLPITMKSTKTTAADICVTSFDYIFLNESNFISHFLWADTIDKNKIAKFVDWHSSMPGAVPRLASLDKGLFADFGKTNQAVENACFFIPKNWSFTIRNEYYRTGKKMPVKPRLGLHLYKGKAPPRPIKELLIWKNDFRIPANTNDYLVNTTFRLKKDILVLAVHPHMHHRGRSMKFSVKRPDDKNFETIFSAPHFEFRWQNIFWYKEPFKLPKGTIIDLSASYDNSAANDDNPDNKATVSAVQSVPFVLWEKEMFKGRIFYLDP